MGATAYKPCAKLLTSAIRLVRQALAKKGERVVFVGDMVATAGVNRVHQKQVKRVHPGLFNGFVKAGPEQLLKGKEE